MSARFAPERPCHAASRRGAAAGNGRPAPPVLLAGGGKGPLPPRGGEPCATNWACREQVRFLGFCDHVPRLLMTHQVCVLSTHYEGMPLSLVEGMAAGCAVVGSAVTGVKEVLNDGINGRLVPHADPAALAGALEGLLRDRLPRRWCCPGPRHSTGFSLELMTQRYEDPLRLRLAAGHPGRR